MLELIAAQNGIVWGSCHFHFAWKHRKTNVLNACPPIDMNRTVVVGTQTIYWHFPLQNLPPKARRAYDNNLDRQLDNQEKRFFVVVRNPYDKLISLYYMENQLSVKKKNNATYMNTWIQSRLREPVTELCSGKLKCLGTALVPQANFIWDEKGHRMVHHVLRFERIHEEFQELKELYDLPANLTIPVKHVNRRVGKSVLNRSHFTAETLELIHERFHKDFDLAGGYERLKA